MQRLGEFFNFVVVSQMNLRSVFTAEQQRILERYYDNGMTNQSKACFQLILQCAQEAKLDFSVVRVNVVVFVWVFLKNIYMGYNASLVSSQ